MERTFVEWNVVNWVTVLLMVAVGTAIVGMVSQFIRTNVPGASA